MSRSTLFMAILLRFAGNPPSLRITNADEQRPCGDSCNDGNYYRPGKYDRKEDYEQLFGSCFDTHDRQLKVLANRMSAQDMAV